MPSNKVDSAALTIGGRVASGEVDVAPTCVFQEINASQDEELVCVLVRSGQEPIVVNLDITPVEPPETVYWVDPIHPHPGACGDSTAT